MFFRNFVAVRITHQVLLLFCQFFSDLSGQMHTCEPSQRNVWWSLSLGHLHTQIHVKTSSPGDTHTHTHMSSCWMWCSICSRSMHVCFASLKLCSFAGFSHILRELRSPTIVWWTSTQLEKISMLWQKPTTSLKWTQTPWRLWRRYTCE